MVLQVPLPSGQCLKAHCCSSCTHLSFLYATTEPDVWLWTYADDSTLVALVSSPLDRVAVAEWQNRDLNRVNQWYIITFEEWDWMWARLRQWLSPGHAQITMHSQSPPLILGSTILKLVGGWMEIIIYHDFLPTPRRGSHVKSDKKTHTVIKIHPLSHILDSWALIFRSCALFTVYPNCIM